MFYLELPVRHVQIESYKDRDIDLVASCDLSFQDFSRSSTTERLASCELSFQGFSRSTHTRLASCELSFQDFSRSTHANVYRPVPLESAIFETCKISIFILVSFERK